MTVVPNLKEKLFNRLPVDVVGIDCSSQGTRLMRLKKTDSYVPQVVGLDMLPGIAFGENQPDKVPALSISAKARGRYAALCLPSQRDAVKLLRVPESFDVSNRDELINRLARDPAAPERVSSRLLVAGSAKSEARILVAAMPEDQAAGLIQLMPATGMPATRSLTLSEIAVMNAFQNDPRWSEREDACGLIHFDDDYSLIAMFNGGVLSQFRIFSFGVAMVLNKVMNTLNVDRPTAEGVLMDGAFDISHLIEENFRDVRSQLVICRDFMERSENCTLQQLFLSGPASLTRPFAEAMPAGEDFSAWNPLEPYAEGSPGTMPGELISEPWRFAAALGAGLGVLLPS